MSTLEKQTLLSTKTLNELTILYPITTVDSVIGLDEATTESPGLLSPDDKAKIDKLPTDGQPYAFVVKRDSGGIYVDL